MVRRACSTRERIAREAAAELAERLLLHRVETLNAASSRASTAPGVDRLVSDALTLALAPIRGPDEGPAPWPELSSLRLLAIVAPAAHAALRIVGNRHAEPDHLAGEVDLAGPTDGQGTLVASAPYRLAPNALARHKAAQGRCSVVSAAPWPAVALAHLAALRRVQAEGGP